MMVLRASRVLTFAGRDASALAYQDGRIVAVGSEEEVRGQVGSDATVEDLGERVVLPGFIDPHHHLVMTAVYNGGVDLHGTLSVDEITERLRRATAGIPKGEWLVGVGFDHFRLAERRPPTRAELDAACPDHPVFLMHYSFHEGVASSRALEAAGIGRGAADPPAGSIERGRSGEPTGRLIETAIGPVEVLASAALSLRDGEGLRRRLRALEQRCLAAGITRIGDAAVTPQIEEQYRSLRAAGDLMLPVVMMPVGRHGYLAHPRDRLDGPHTGEGSDELRIGSLKLFMDGGEACAFCVGIGQGLRAVAGTLGHAARRRSLAPLRGLGRVKLRLGRDGRLRAGILYYPSDDAAGRMVSDAIERGFSVAIHAIGNDAVARALSAFERVRARHPDALPPRIEHAMFLDQALIRRARELDVTVVSQPAFTTLFTQDDLPAIPGLSVLAFRDLLDAGVPVAASSDSPAAPLEPLVGVRAAVGRKTADGATLDAAQAITVTEALGLYTRAAARALGCLDVVGTLEPGKRADLVVLSADPLRRELAEVRVERTVLGGRTVFDASVESA